MAAGSFIVAYSHICNYSNKFSYLSICYNEENINLLIILYGHVKFNDRDKIYILGENNDFINYKDKKIFAKFTITIHMMLKYKFVSQ